MSEGGMKDIAIFLFTLNPTTAKPWLDAGYECWLVDIQHPVAYETEGVTYASDKLRHKTPYSHRRRWES